MFPKHYWHIIVTYILMHLSGFFAIPLISTNFEKDPYVTLANWNVIAFSIATLIIISILQKHRVTNEIKKQATLSQVIGWSFLGLFMAFGAQALAILIELNLLGIEPGSENTEQIFSLMEMTPIFVVIPAILAPILEEIVFRKIIFGTLYKRMNFFLAAIISSLIFGIIHFDLTHLLIYTAMGFVFAFLYIKTKRIIVPIIVHMGMNTLPIIAYSIADPEQLEQIEQNLSLILFWG